MRLYIWEVLKTNEENKNTDREKKNGQRIEERKIPKNI